MRKHMLCRYVGRNQKFLKKCVLINLTCPEISVYLTENSPSFSYPVLQRTFQYSTEIILKIICSYRRNRYLCIVFNPNNKAKTGRGKEGCD